jgi:hypothetical protein
VVSPTSSRFSCHSRRFGGGNGGKFHTMCPRDVTATHCRHARLCVRSGGDGQQLALWTFLVVFSGRTIGGEPGLLRKMRFRSLMIPERTAITASSARLRSCWPRAASKNRLETGSDAAAIAQSPESWSARTQATVALPTFPGSPAQPRLILGASLRRTRSAKRAAGLSVLRPAPSQRWRDTVPVAPTHA